MERRGRRGGPGRLGPLRCPEDRWRHRARRQGPRGSRDGEVPGVHLLTAYAPEVAAVVAQMRVDGKTNEHKAALELLGVLPEGKVLTADAAFTHRDFARRSCAGGGDYILPVKDNQPQLRADVEAAFAVPTALSPWQRRLRDQSMRVASEVGKGTAAARSGCCWRRPGSTTTWTGPGSPRSSCWRERTVGHETTVEEVFGVTSLSPQEASAAQLLAWVRRHWSIENQLFGVRDVTLAEDACRVRKGAAAEVLGGLRNAAVHLLSGQGYRAGRRPTPLHGPSARSLGVDDDYQERMKRPCSWIRKNGPGPDCVLGSLRPSPLATRAGTTESMMKTRWTTVTPSNHVWERAALDFIQGGLPDHEPYRAWSNFEFQTHEGGIYEVDLLVLTKHGFWLVEIKSRPGRVEGDAGTWTWTDPKGKRVSLDNPVLLANRKAKALSSLLKPKMAAQKVATPWLEALVFLSDPDLRCDLQGTGRNRVVLADREATEGRAGRKGVLAALVNREAPGVEPVGRDEIDVRTAKALTRAMEHVGVRPSQKARRVGDYVLQRLLDEGPGVYQDRLAEHAALPGVFRRVRQYLVSQAAVEEDRERRKRAAAREFRILQSFDHPGILDVLDYKDHEFGPALLFACEPEAMRLDHYLLTRGPRLNPGTRLELVRQVADAVRYAHGKKVIHRALAPQSVLVIDPDASVPRLKVFNWQVGVREAEAASSATVHVTDLVDRQVTVYMAPEALIDPKAATEASDVFSLGAIAYHVFTGRPPGDTPADVARSLAESRGLRVSAALDGAGPELEEMVRWSTDPDVDMRVESAADFLRLLDDVEEELTDPDGGAVADPAAARPGDRIEGGFEVVRFLGQGATGVALLARRGDEEVVLKVARTPDDDARLREEAEALRKVRSEFVVGLHEERPVRGRTVLVLDKAGDETLAERLRKEGRLGLELLQRFGEDLLQAVAALEQQGVVHRDIKPDNIGVRSGKQRLQLVLFDFSLARVPPEQVHVGTHPYLDPFLSARKPRPRWDPSAERYAAGVTLYEMAAGVLPRWGNGRSDPALTDAGLSVEAERFDPAVRDGLCSFFQTALSRDLTARFDNAEGMLRAWRGVFQQAERRTVTTPAGQEIPLHVGLDQVDPETLVALLGLSTRATNALDRAGVTNVRQLLALPAGDVRFMRGVGKKTRDEIVAALDRLRRRFPDQAVGKPAERPSAGFDEPAAPDLDALRERLIGSDPRNRVATVSLKIRGTYLGLDGSAGGDLDWPSQSEVAVQLRKKRQQVGQVLTVDRERWSRDRHVTALRDEVLKILQGAGGVMALAELADALVALRGTALAAVPARTTLASALVRVVFDAEQIKAEPKLHLRRGGRGPLLAVSPVLAAYAGSLGAVADALAGEEPLAPAQRVFQRLYEVAQPEFPADVTPPNNDRLLRLAVAASASAAVSSRQELYPRGMPARRALQLGLGALAGLEAADAGRGERFDPRAIRERVSARYPEAETLPDRPELDELLREAGLDVVWDEPTTTYRRPSEPREVTSGSTRPRRYSTHTGSRRPARQVDSEVAAARQFDERLRYALRDGSFLALSVRPSQMLACERQILDRFPTLERVSFDRLLIDRLKARAAEDEVDWQVVLKADAKDASEEDRVHLADMVAEVVPAVEAALLAKERPVLLVHPGLLARFDLMDLVVRLRDRVGRRGVCPGMWILVAEDEQSDLPRIDNREVPLIGSGQRARVPLAWIDNRFRADAASSVAS
ncbi:MAG: BREX system serine/threonine kinase PglW [Isosphaeraceae bacterium]